MGRVGADAVQQWSAVPAWEWTAAEASLLLNAPSKDGDDGSIHGAEAFSAAVRELVYRGALDVHAVIVPMLRGVWKRRSVAVTRTRAAADVADGPLMRVLDVIEPERLAATAGPVMGVELRALVEAVKGSYGERYAWPDGASAREIFRQHTPSWTDRYRAEQVAPVLLAHGYARVEPYRKLTAAGLATRQRLVLTDNGRRQAERLRAWRSVRPRELRRWAAADPGQAVRWARSGGGAVVLDPRRYSELESVTDLAARIAALRRLDKVLDKLTLHEPDHPEGG